MTHLSGHEDQKDSPLRKFEWGLFVFVVIAACVAVVAYTIAFAGWVVGDPVDWGTFGDYIGGVLNPIIGIVTVLLIVLTLATTRKEAADSRAEMKAQLLHFKRQEQLNELQKRLDGAMAGWAGFLATNGHGLPLHLHPNGSIKYAHEKLMGEVFDSVDIDLISQLKDSKHAREANERWRARCRNGITLMTEIGQYCDEYDDAAGNRTLTEFYRRRLFVPAEVLYAVGVIDASIINKFFMYEPNLFEKRIADGIYTFILQSDPGVTNVL